MQKNIPAERTPDEMATMIFEAHYSISQNKLFALESAIITVSYTRTHDKYTDPVPYWNKVEAILKEQLEVVKSKMGL